MTAFQIHFFCFRILLCISVDGSQPCIRLFVNVRHAPNAPNDASGKFYEICIIKGASDDKHSLLHSSFFFFGRLMIGSNVHKKLFDAN